ncbi:MAG TPA: aminotransferase class V-fold PLP-dependent enzyme [Burkholderiales bacterium]|nr:aminotransferase class V-fold PLP-dependent enzyme [Burkholderiales bacterium]
MQLSSGLRLGSHFSRFFTDSGDWLHCTAHSHHPWPDATRAAQLAYWDDAVRFTDRKWDRIFGEVLPEAQRHVAHHLRLPRAEQIAFAPNTHEFVVRLYSCLDWRRVQRVVTTAHEFHSFERQTRRLEETGRLSVTRVAAEPYETFVERFCAQLVNEPDLVWLSQVFFDSGFLVADLERIVRACPESALVVLDGYHAFGALPVDLAAIANRAFYLAGGYKYAMAGEGACFLAVPTGSTLRPLATGWFADFDGLVASQTGAVGYGEGGMRFFGATFDPSGLYRFNAVMRWLAELGVEFADVHAHVQRLQRQFLDAMSARPLPALPLDRLTPPRGVRRGNFLTFALPWASEAETALTKHHVSVDRRRDRLRFGFGIYHDEGFIDSLVERVREALAGVHER